MRLLRILALLVPMVAGAQTYPTKPVRMVIGFAPGGPADIAGRIIGPRLSEALGQQVIVENRGGAGGTIGMDVVVKAPPDGYTIGLGSSGNLVMAPHLYPKTYSVQKDAKASEMFHALVSVLHESRELLDFSEVQPRGKWGSPTARAFPVSLKNAFRGAIVEWHRRNR